MATPEGKRKAEEPSESNGVDSAKRPRLDGGSAAAGAAKPKPSIDLSVLEKAKKALQLQKELKEKLKKLQAPAAAGTQPAASAAAAAAPAAVARPPAAALGLPPGPAAVLAALAAKAPAAPTALPPPLLVDDQGRELDAAGRPLPARPAAGAAAGPGPAAAAAAGAGAAGEREGGDSRFFDPSIGNRGLARLQRRPRAGLQFVEEGRFQKQAETARLRAKFGDDAVRQLQERRKQEAEMAAEGIDANLIPLGARAEMPPAQEPEDPIPDVEWWDVRLLADKNSMPEIAEGGEVRLRPDRITHLVEHPVLIEPPAEAPPPPPQPLKLTKRELKKLRTQRRVAREKEKQELVRQGMLEPPKPKVKISNLMRVLGAEATADPTAIEAEVRRQMAERAAAHEDRNLARKLTPAERKDKKLKKLLGEEPGAGAVETHVALYKVGDLSRPQLRFKVDVNAKENHLTGGAVLADDFAMVIVEGGAKPLNRYQKLMLRRVDWNQGREEEEEAAEAGEGAGGAARKPPNYCHLVWQGVVKDRHFKKFTVEAVRTEAAARKFLSDHGVAHYWDLCAAYTQE